MRDYKGNKADRLVTRIDPGVVSMVAELRAHERQSDEELDSLEKRGRWSWRNREGRTTRWIRCRKPSIGCAPWGACPSIPRQRRGPRRATADGWRDGVEWEPPWQAVRTAAHGPIPLMDDRAVIAS